MKKTCFVVTVTTITSMLFPNTASASIEIPHSLTVFMTDASYFAGRYLLMFATFYFGLNWWSLRSARKRIEEEEDGE